MFDRARNLTALLTLLLVGPAQGVDLRSSDPPNPGLNAPSLKPEQGHQQAGQAIFYLLDRHHYSGPSLDDEFSRRAFNRYLDSMDPNRVYFTAADVKRFSDYQYDMEDMLRTGRLQPAFEHFVFYRMRVLERVDYALELLEQNYDFSLDEHYIPDRGEQPWSAHTEELNHTWRKRIKYELLNLHLGGKEQEEAKKSLEQRYRQLRRRIALITPEDVFNTFVNAFISAIDPHSLYLSPHQAENFDIHMRLSLEGIGAMLSTNDLDMTEIRGLLPGGPAMLSGEVQVADQIVGVGQGETGNVQDIVGLRLRDVVKLIRGPRGSMVRLKLLPREAGLGGPTRIVRLVRDTIKLEESAVSSSILELQPESARIGILKIPSFYVDFKGRAENAADYRSTTRDARRELLRLQEQGIDGLVVDLRNNGGGSLDEVTSLTGLFITSGPVLQTRNRLKQVAVKKDPNPSLAYAGPLSVLVNRHSASASEIFAAAIQDYQRGMVVGETTFGKGTVQNLLNLNDYHKGEHQDLGHLKLTVAQFYRVSGRSNQFHGVQPDIFFPRTEVVDSFGERALKNALPSDSVDALGYPDTTRPHAASLYSELRRKHLQRLEQNEVFLLFQEASAYARRLNEIKSISLNNAVRLEEYDQRKKFIQDIENLPKYKTLPRPVQSGEAAGPEAEAHEVDFFLYESALILNDFITRQQPHTTAQVTEQPPSATPPRNHPPAPDARPHW